MSVGREFVLGEDVVVGICVKIGNLKMITKLVIITNTINGDSISSNIRMAGVLSFNPCPSR